MAAAARIGDENEKKEIITLISEKQSLTYYIPSPSIYMRNAKNGRYHSNIAALKYIALCESRVLAE